MTSPLTLITGGSRGLGWALVQHCLEAGHRVLCIARRPPPASPAGLTVWTRDLEDALPVSEDLERWLSVQPVPTEVNLINNAGVISELCDLSEGDGADLRRALRVGLEAPTLLTSAFLRATSAWTVPRRVVLVSSGLGRRAMAGSATYCAAKAGMDHLARAVALEEAARPHGARVPTSARTRWATSAFNSAPGRPAACTSCGRRRSSGAPRAPAPRPGVQLGQRPVAGAVRRAQVVAAAGHEHLHARVAAQRARQVGRGAGEAVALLLAAVPVPALVRWASRFSIS
jgi:benzil reductase ((S)-benzoin forming)